MLDQAKCRFGHRRLNVQDDEYHSRGKNNAVPCKFERIVNCNKLIRARSIIEQTNEFS